MITTSDVKSLVESAVKSEWSRFAVEHPRLAQVLSEPVVLAGVQQSLAADKAYQQAIEDAILIEAGLQAIGNVVAGAVRRWFDILL